MKERIPVMSCELCDYKCTLDSVNGGRLLRDLEGGSEYLPKKIEDCHARLILKSTPMFLKEVARGLVQEEKKRGE